MHWLFQGAMKSCPSGLLPGTLLFPSISSATPIHSSKPNSTIPSPRKSSLPNKRANHIYPSQQHLRTHYSNSSCTKHTIADHIPRAKRCPKGTGNKALNKMHKELIVNNLINSMVSGRIIFYYFNDIFQVPYLLQ